MRIVCSLLVVVICAVGCGVKGTKETENKRFKEFSDQFVEQLWRQYPTWASSAGYHRYDSVLVVPSEQNRKLELAFLERIGDTLATFDTTQLEASALVDYALIRNFVDGSLWSINEFKAWQWNPSEYNLGGVFAEMLNNNYDSLDTRLINLSKRLKWVPDYYRQAKINIVNPTYEHTQLAVEQNRGSISIFTTDLPAALAQSGLDSSFKQSMLADAQRAVAAIENFCDYLSNFNNPNPRSFRIGSELYKQKFKYDIQSAYTPDAIYADALAHKADLHAKMYGITQQLWKTHFANQPMPADSLLCIRMLIDTLSVKHTTQDSFQLAIERQIPELVDFVNAKKLIYLDPSKPLVVRKEPDYMGGVAGASISAPGPYDKNGNTYYNVGNIRNWDKERAESYLREYNHWILQILNIHEAIPGHYTQLVYSNQSPSLIKSILGNGAMVEGWAVYTEKMMLENGYGNQSPEMWLMYYKWNLRTTCNTILDYGIHNLNWSKEKVLELLTREAFQQQAEAEGKWRRATLTQVQLCSYYTGFREICSLRDRLEQKQGKAFNLKAFHEQFLSYGSAPVPLVARLMEQP